MGRYFKFSFIAKTNEVLEEKTVEIPQRKAIWISLKDFGLATEGGGICLVGKPKWP